MTDREQLELAAKAAGIDAQWDCPERGMMMLTPDDIDTMTWNPLTDDGDALRLAVKLCMSVTNTTKRTSILARPDPEFGDWIADSEPHLYDPYAATRRAIVRAAAEIGRGIAQQAASTDLPEDNYYKSMAEAEEIGRAAAEIGRQMP